MLIDLQKQGGWSQGKEPDEHAESGGCVRADAGSPSLRGAGGVGHARQAQRDPVPD